jgi:signal transduction histidine kinase
MILDGSRARLPCLLAALLAASCRRDGHPPAPPLTSLHELRRALMAAESGERSVDVRGVVTYSDAAAGMLYLQGATGSAAIPVGEVGAPVVGGESVQLSGALPGAGRTLLRPRLTVHARSSQELMPEPRRLDLDALRAHEAETEWVEVHGVVRSVAVDGPSLLLDLQQQGRRFRAEVVNPDQARHAWLVDFRVRMRGVSPARHHLRPRAADLLVPDMGHLRLVEDAPADPFTLPLASPARLRAMPPAARPDHRVRVIGTVLRVVFEQGGATAHPLETPAPASEVNSAAGGAVAAGLESRGMREFVLAADGGEWLVSASDTPALSANDRVELVAFAGSRDGAPAFEEARIRRLADRPRADGNASAPALPLLTTAEQVRRLSPAEALKGYPIRLQAVVTYNDPDMRLLFVQDHTAGIYVEAWRHIHRLEPGDRVSIDGRSSPGAFAPIVDHPRVRVLRPGPLPAARPVRPESLASVREDSQWVEVEGVVRAVTFRGRAAVIRMAEGGVRFAVEMPAAAAPDLAPLVDARVRVRAVCHSLLTQKGQLADVLLHSPGPTALEVITPPPADPSTLPLRPIRSLLQFVPGQVWEHRVRVQGVATFSQPGELFLSDGTGGLPVRTDRRPPPPVGAQVEAIGFAVPGDYGPRLEDADVRSLGQGSLPGARDVTAEQAMRGQVDGELVRLEARLLDVVRGPEQSQLSLQSGPYLFTGLLRGAPSWPRQLRAGARLRLTGICAVSAREQHVPQAFRLLLRAPGDVEVLSAGPWWTPQRAAWAVAGMVGLIGLALAWVATLRRRVATQSLIIWDRVKRETELQERQRMARELHDTLEQNLTGISLSLEAASLTLPGAPGMAEQHLGRALEQVEASIEEVHRAVWSLRDESLDARGLAASLDEIARQLVSCSPRPVDVHTRTTGGARPFALAVENNLLRIGQEALTNAVKHGQAERVEVELRYQRDAFELWVSDDGRGFDAAAPAGPGHFGLVGMQERAREIGARFEVRSLPGRGTRVQVSLPLPPLAYVSEARR